MANPEEFRVTVPPNSVVAEVSVLGAMLQDSAAVLRDGAPAAGGFLPAGA